MADRVVKVRLMAQVAEYVANMKAAAQATKEVAEAGGKSFLGSVADSFGKAKTSALEMGREVRKAATENRQEWDTVGKTLAGVGTAITAVGTAAIVTGVRYNQMQQSTRAALTTLLGSAEAAAAQMDRLDEFARKSPFSKQTFITAQQQMLAFGIETRKVIPYLDAVQNAVAAAGGSSRTLGEITYIMSQIKAASKITATDLMQFGQRGIDAAGLIGAAMGKTGAQIREEITAGTLGADEALDALAKGMTMRFDGAAANVKNTFSGAMDRVQAAWRDFSSELAKPLVNPNGGGMLVDLLNWSADVMRNFEKLPEPVKHATTGLTGFAGAGALAVGSLMLVVPRAIETASAFKTLGEQMPKTSAALGAIGKWGGIVAGVSTAVLIGVDALVAYARELRGTDEAIRAATTTGQSFLKSMDDLGVTTEATASSVTAALDAIASGNVFGPVGLDVLSLRDALTELDTGFKGLPLPDAIGKFQQWGKELGLTRGQMSTMLNELPSLRNAIADHLMSTGQAADAESILQYAMEGASGAAQTQASQLEELQGVATATETAVGALEDAIRGFGSAAFDTEQAAIKFQDAVAGLDGQLLSGEGSLDIYSEAGRRTLSAMLDAARSTNDYAASIAAMGGSTEQVQGILEAGRQKIIDTRIALGDSEEAARTYADQLIATPEAVATAVELNGVAEAEEGLSRLARTRTSRIAVEYTISGSGSKYRDNFRGNLYNRGVQAFASGGFPSGMYKGVHGGIHKFAESEMNVPWETYISGRPQDRERNIGIWQETGRRLGLGGDSAGAPAGGGGPSGPIDLSSATIRRIVQGFREAQPNVVLDSQSIAGAVHDATANNAFRGA